MNFSLWHLHFEKKLKNSNCENILHSRYEIMNFSLWLFHFEKIEKKNWKTSPCEKILHFAGTRSWTSAYNYSIFKKTEKNSNTCKLFLKKFSIFQVRDNELQFMTSPFSKKLKNFSFWKIFPFQVQDIPFFSILFFIIYVSISQVRNNELPARG